ncbi:MAG: hypothetical protein AAB378_02375 [Patescibacteria group bacterium]
MFESFNPFSKERRKEEKNALKSEHLKEGVKPIMACIFDSENLSEYRAFEALDQGHALPVDYFFRDEMMREKELTNAGEKTYVISPNNEQDKFSYGYRNCTGVVVVGRSKENGKEISFMSHEDPQRFLEDVTSKFTVDLKRKISELKALSEDGTVDAVVFGGNYFKSLPDYIKNYLDSVKLLDKIIEKELGFSPVVLAGPNVVGGDQAIYFDTQHRRIYMLKPEDLKKTNVPYMASKARQEEEKWKEAAQNAAQKYFSGDF